MNVVPVLVVDRDFGRCLLGRVDLSSRVISFTRRSLKNRRNPNFAMHSENAFLFSPLGEELELLDASHIFLSASFAINGLPSRPVDDIFILSVSPVRALLLSETRPSRLSLVSSKPLAITPRAFELVLAARMTRLG